MRRERDRDELVVRFAVKRWLRREPSIMAEGYGPESPQRTSWWLLQEAAIYPELHLDPLEVRLWRELRRLGDCLEIRFPRQEIDAEDRMEQLLFPGLEVRRSGTDSFTVGANGQVREKNMAYKLVVSKEAHKDIDDIVHYIAVELANPTAAASFLTLLFDG